MRRALIVIGSLITAVALVGGVNAVRIGNGNEIGTYARCSSRKPHPTTAPSSTPGTPGAASTSHHPSRINPTNAKSAPRTIGGALTAYRPLKACPKGPHQHTPHPKGHHVTNEPLTPTQMAGRIRASLTTIRALWDDMLTPTTPAPTSQRRGTAPPPRDEHDNRDDDLPRTLRIINIRKEVHADLMAWTNMLHAWTPDLGHPGMDLPDLCDYLTAHADTLALADGAHQAITDDVEAVEHVIYGAKPKGQLLGPCPNPNGCTGSVRTTTTPSNPDGLPEARCGTCATTDTLTNWARTMTGEWTTTLTTPDVIALAHADYGITLKPNAIHQLTKRGALHPIDPDAKPCHYHLVEVVDYLTKRRART